MIPLVGLLITKEDHEVFGDWCQEQLPLYDAVVCLDGSQSRLTRRIAEEFSAKLVYVHENQFEITHATDHGLRSILHEEITRRFGQNAWIMCCHVDEFCYHDPRKIANLAEVSGFDHVSWFSPHFYPHPTELPSLAQLSGMKVPERFHYYHWGHAGTEYPWIEDRLYRSSRDVHWDGVTQGSVRPVGLSHPAPFHPILKHYKVCSLDINCYEAVGGHALYANHWTDQGDFRTGLAFSVSRVEDLFVDRVPKYAYCDRFEGTFRQSWNIGEQYRVTSHTLADSQASTVAQLRSIQNTISRGSLDQAKGDLVQMRGGLTDARTRAIVCNNLGAIDALDGRDAEAALAFEASRLIDRSLEVATRNRLVVDRLAETPSLSAARRGRNESSQLPRIAILSLLFNWPSTGGGIVHTKELGEFLNAAGFEVCHIFAQYERWGIGCCTEPLSVNSVVLHFEDEDWSLENVIVAFRRAIADARPDYVLITDSWNFKPWLAKAAHGYPYVMRYQALENLCPLNNIRLLPRPGSAPTQCRLNQLANPQECHDCCRINEQYSGRLHQLERTFSRVGSLEYDQVLRDSIRDAAAVLVVNPLMKALFDPWNANTHVVPSGFDASRFQANQSSSDNQGIKRIVFAGIVGEYMKGFHILHEAAELLWKGRRDFEIVVTSDDCSGANDFMRFVGWLSQAELAALLQSADLLVFPTIAQEALGRSAVEAMGAGIPVVASRIGGLSFTVRDNETGLLFEPGDPVDLAEKVSKLLDNVDLRKQLGSNGRKRFLSEFTWQTIIDKHYRPLFPARIQRGVS